MTSMNFNSVELEMISNSLLMAIENCNNAEKLVSDNNTKIAIQKEMKMYQKLNARVCKMNIEN